MATDKKISALDQILDRITPAEKSRSRRRMRLATTLDDILKDKKISKVQFAKAMGKEPSVITKWLSGAHNMTLDTLSDICDFLAIPLSKLVEEKPKTVTHISKWNMQVSSAHQIIATLGNLPLILHGATSVGYHKNPYYWIYPNCTPVVDPIKELRDILKGDYHEKKSNIDDHFITLDKKALRLHPQQNIKTTKTDENPG